MSALPSILILLYLYYCFFVFFFFNDPSPTEIYTLSLHDALPICHCRGALVPGYRHHLQPPARYTGGAGPRRSEEHTSELQSRPHLVCRLLLEKKKNIQAQVHSEPIIRLILYIATSAFSAIRRETG